MPNTQQALKETPLSSFEKQTHTYANKKINNNLLKNSSKFIKKNMLAK